MEVNPRIFGRLHRDAIQVGIIIAEHDVYFSGKLRQFVHHKRRTQVAATNKRAGILHVMDRRRKVPEVIVNVRENRNSHSLFVEIPVPGMALEYGKSFFVQHSRRGRAAVALHRLDAPHSRNHARHRLVG